MKPSRSMLHAAVLASLAAISGPHALAQGFPAKPLRMITADPGGSSDFAARIIAQAMQDGLGQAVVVENRGGGSGVIAIQAVAKAPADGYTMLLYSSGMWILPLMQQVPYDSIKDFAPLTLAAKAPNILVVHPSVPVKSVKELVQYAKSNPGVLNYASGGTGTSTHLAAELLKYMTGTNIVRITYKGGGPALNSVLAGETQLLFGTSASVSPHVKSGKLRALGVTSDKPSALAPDLPTVAESIPGYESESMTGMFAPAGTPGTIVGRINQELVRALGKPDVKERFMKVGVETVGSTPEQLATIMKSEIARLGKMIKEAGIQSD